MFADEGLIYLFGGVASYLCRVIGSCSKLEAISNQSVPHAERAPSPGRDRRGRVTMALTEAAIERRVMVKASLGQLSGEMEEQRVLRARGSSCRSAASCLCLPSCFPLAEGGAVELGQVGTARKAKGEGEARTSRRTPPLKSFSQMIACSSVRAIDRPISTSRRRGSSRLSSSGMCQVFKVNSFHRLFSSRLKPSGRS
jgi:hypothetical protein